MKAAPRYKMAILVWIAIYPTITLIFFFAGEHLIKLPLLLRTFVLTVILVSLMVFVFIPFLTKLFRKWLNPELKKEKVLIEK
jgi:uncharacterized protein